MAKRQTRPRQRLRARRQITTRTRNQAQRKPVIVVAGDVCIDVLGLEHPPARTGPQVNNWQLAGQTITQYRFGGAWLAAQMTAAAVAEIASVRMQYFPQKPWDQSQPLTDESELSRLMPDDVIHSFLEIGEFPQKIDRKDHSRSKDKVYRIKQFHGFAGPTETPRPRLQLKIKSDTRSADIVVCDDVGNGFRARPEDWPLAIADDGAKPIVIYKLARPLPPYRDGSSEVGNESPLWHRIIQQHLSRTIVCVDVNDLRLADIHISRRLSWERTAKELVGQLLSNSALAELRNCHHLIITFGSEGALYYCCNANRDAIAEFAKQQQTIAAHKAAKEAALRDRKPPLPELTEQPIVITAAERHVVLIYDPQRVEDGLRDEHPGMMSGHRAAFTVGLTDVIARNLPRFREHLEQMDDQAVEAMTGAIKAGLAASRRLHRQGLGRPPRHDGTLTLRIPTISLFGPPNREAGAAPRETPKTRKIREDEWRKSLAKEQGELAHVRVPLNATPEHPNPDRWDILTADNRCGSVLEKIARDMVLGETVSAVSQVPRGEFGKLTTYDRTEIEGFRTVRNLIDEFLKNPAPKRPLCLAVFGPPGSGKSYGVVQVAASLAGGEVKVHKMEFNVSQFCDTEELSAALQLVRDRVLVGEVPLVFFDEFDAALGDQSYGWLKYFLAPMQDGTFLDRGALHPVGKAIFVFAGGTRQSFQAFAKMEPEANTPDGDPSRREFAEFRDAKGPDFVSRLRGYVNVRGPNPVGPHDHAFVIRRANLLRQFLTTNAKHLIDAEKRALIDAGVLRAMLKISRYHHGARSLEAILDMSMLANRKRFESSGLPSPDQLSLHVPQDEFLQLLIADQPFGEARERMGRAIHEKYRRDQSAIKSANHPAMQPWEKLSADLRASNLAQADDIPRKLDAIGVAFEFVGPDVADLDKQNAEVFKVALGRTKANREQTMDVLAKLEHERWEAERRRAGWQFASTRDDTRKMHPNLIPWEQLTKAIQDFDRKAVATIPAILADAGFRVFRTGP